MTKPQFDNLHIERYDSGGYRITINPRPVQEGTTSMQFKDMKFAKSADELMDWIGHLVENQTDEENALAWEAEKEEQASLARELRPSPVKDLTETPIIQDLITQIDEQKSRIESLEQTSGARTAKMQGYTREHYELSTRLKKMEESHRSAQSIILRLEERISGLEDQHDGLNKCYGRHSSIIQALQTGQSEIATEFQAAIKRGRDKAAEINAKLEKFSSRTDEQHETLAKLIEEVADLKQLHAGLSPDAQASHSL